jgi:hypothetical protein
MNSENFTLFVQKANFFKIASLVAIFLAGILLIFINPYKTTASDFMTFAWYPGQEFLSTGTVHPGYPYPFWTLVTMLPITIWPSRIAVLLWFICNLIMLACSIVLLIRIFEWRVSPVFILTITILCGYFLPVLTSLWLGQLTIFLMLILALTAYMIKYHRWIWLGIVLGLSFIKPQVMILLVGFLLLWALLHRRWQVLIGFSITIIILLIISIPFVSNPAQVFGGGIESHLVTYIQQTSTLWGLLLLLGFSWWVPFTISMVLFVWLVYGWSRLPFHMVESRDQINFMISITIIINLIIVPYSWMHNLVLLLFPLGYGLTLVLRMKNGARIIWAVLLFGIMYPLMLGVYNKLSGPLGSQTYQVIPAILLLPLVYYINLNAVRQS